MFNISSNSNSFFPTRQERFQKITPPCCRIQRLRTTRNSVHMQHCVIHAINYIIIVTISCIFSHIILDYRCCTIINAGTIFECSLSFWCITQLGRWACILPINFRYPKWTAILLRKNKRIIWYRVTSNTLLLPHPCTFLSNHIRIYLHTGIAYTYYPNSTSKFLQYIAH